MKVYGGLTFVKGRQVRTIVAAKSMKQAAELTGEKYSSFREYWSETGNEIELQVANSQPGCVFKASSSMGNDFAPSSALAQADAACGVSPGAMGSAALVDTEE